MKPWEQKWMVDGCDRVEQEVSLETVAHLNSVGTWEENASMCRLIAAAPDMARALMSIRLDSELGDLAPDVAHQLCEQALRKAGVIP